MSNEMCAYGPQAYGTYWFPSRARTVPEEKKNERSKARRKRGNKENDENNG